MVQKSERIRLVVVGRIEASGVSLGDHGVLLGVPLAGPELLDLANTDALAENSV
jgi:hypothetical protein